MVEVLLRSRSGRALAPRLEAAELVAPELLDVEVASAFRRLVLRGQYEASQALTALEVLHDWPIGRVSHRDLIARSARWWRNVTAYDATYLTVGLIYDATVVTVDGPLARAHISEVTVENVRVA